MAFDAFVKRCIEHGNPIFPKKYSISGPHTDEKKSLSELLKEYGNYSFSCQLNNDPIDEEVVEFKRHWFKRLVLDPVMRMEMDKAASILSVDPAFRLKETNDCSGFCLTKTIESNYVCVLEAFRKKTNSQGVVDEIFRLVTLYKPYKVLVEVVAAQMLLADILRTEMRKRNIFFTLEELKTSTKETKAIRIRSLIPHYANGRILHNSGLEELEGELVEFPRGSHDDIIDALSYQEPYWKAVKGSKQPMSTPYMSMNWWKNLTPRNAGSMEEIFKEFVRRR